MVRLPQDMPSNEKRVLHGQGRAEMKLLLFSLGMMANRINPIQERRIHVVWRRKPFTLQERSYQTFHRCLSIACFGNAKCRSHGQHDSCASSRSCLPWIRGSLQGETEWMPHGQGGSCTLSPSPCWRRTGSQGLPARPLAQ